MYMNLNCFRTSEDGHITILEMFFGFEYWTLMRNQSIFVKACYQLCYSIVDEINYEQM